jgi:hypothetical protein
VLAHALAACAELGQPVTDKTFDTCAPAALKIDKLDLASVLTGDRAKPMERVVVGTALYEPVLRALRRLAHAHVGSDLESG